MLKSRKKTVILTAGLFAILLMAADVSAIDLSPGFRVGAYFDAESAFVGGEVVTRSVLLRDGWVAARSFRSAGSDSRS